MTGLDLQMFNYWPFYLVLDFKKILIYNKGIQQR